MVAVAVAILGLAAGVHLLIKVKEANLGMLYKLLAWKVILISGLFIVGGIVVGWKHMHRMHECHEACERGMMKGAACDMKGMQGECKMDSADCCKIKKDCCKEGEEKACCKDMKMKGGCPEMGGDMKECKDMKGGKGACCMDHNKGAKADSTTKK